MRSSDVAIRHHSVCTVLLSPQSAKTVVRCRPLVITSPVYFRPFFGLWMLTSCSGSNPFIFCSVGGNRVETNREFGELIPRTLLDALGGEVISVFEDVALTLVFNRRVRV
jgi:hypothetical protein